VTSPQSWTSWESEKSSSLATTSAIWWVTPLRRYIPIRATKWVVIDAPLRGIGDWDDQLKNSGHWIMEEQPEQALAVILSFLRGK
jgi:pimeloyl-ACP methyl ester carboxylesterase